MRGASGAYAPFVSRMLAGWDSADPWRVVEASLVFADVSGFTALSERLAKRGNVGAEQLTDLLSAVFEQLVGVITAENGDILSFGGDALFVVFEGDDHPVRACRAAADLQRALRRRSPAHAVVGRVVLGMSIGVHTGPVHISRVGDEYAQLVSAGQTVSTVLALEAAADRGEVLVSPTTAAAVPIDFGPLDRGGHLLPGLPKSRALRVDERVEPGGTVDESLVPPRLRPHIAAGAQPEHRFATICFAKLGGTDALVAMQSHEAVHAELNGVLSAAQDAAQSYGACLLEADVYPDGIKLLFTSGVPDAVPDAVDRALALARDLVDLPTTLDVQVGVNAGRLFAGPVGGHDRRWYTVMGDAVNLAARLMSHAAVRTVLATRTTVEAARTQFFLEAREPFFVKGKTRPVEAFVVGETRGAATPTTVQHLPMRGRDAELATLTTRWNSLDRETGAVVEIVGHAGIGKSRLVQELVASLPDVPLFRVETGIANAGRPYEALTRPLGDLAGLTGISAYDERAERLRTFIRDVDVELEPWSPLLGIPFGVSLPDTRETSELGDDYRAERLRVLFTELLERALPDPTLILVEDAHWLDDASSELLEGVLATAAHRPWMVVATRRPGAEGMQIADGGVTRIALAPLAASDGLALVESILDEVGLPVQTINAIVERANGNPFVLGELLRAVVADSNLESLPDSVESLIAADIDELSPDDRYLLRQAAVLGVAFPERLLADAAGPDALPRIAQLSRFLVHEHDTVRFQHALVRDAAYDALPYRTRAELHRRVAESVAARSDEESNAELLSLHYFHGGAYKEALRCSVVAANRARANVAPTEAAVFLRRAITSLRRTSNDAARIAELEENLADMQERTGGFEDARNALRRARQLVRGDATACARLLQKDAWIEQRLGRLPASLALYTRALNAIRDSEGDDAVALRLELLVARAGIKQRQGHYEESVRLIESELDTLHELAAPPVLARAEFLLDSALSDLGRAGAHEHALAAIRLYQRVDDLYGEMLVVNNLGVELYFEGDWRRSEEQYERSVALATRVGAVVEAATSSNNIGEILSDQGRLDEAEIRFRDALRVWRGAGFAIGIALATSNLARLHSRAGRVDDAMPLFESAVARFERIGAGSFILEAQGRIAEAMLVAREPASALERVERTIESADSAGERGALAAWLERLAACALVQLGDTVEAQKRLDTSLVASVEGGVEFERALTLETIALVSGTDGGAAREIFERLGVRRTATASLVGRERRVV